MDAMYSDVVVKLTHIDGNVFSIIGAVSRALKQAGLVEESKTFIDKAFKEKSYDDVLQLVLKTVTVE